jgi:hypothetical protein
VKIYVLSGLFSSLILSEGFEVTEKTLENGDETISGNYNSNNEQNNETLVSSTSNNVTMLKNNWSSAPQPEDMQRIITPVVITSPHEDRQKNFSASPMLGAIYNQEYYRLNQKHYVKAAQKHQYSSNEEEEEEEEGQKTHQYSQPLSPDLFLAKQYLKIQQHKEQEEYDSRNNRQNFPKPALPEAKNNGYNFNSDSISYKPLKFDTDFPSTLFTSDRGSSMTKGSAYDNKEAPFQYTLPNPMKGNTHPYPYQSPYSSRDDERAPPATSSSAMTAKQYHPGSWMDGYKTGITYQEE